MISKSLKETCRMAEDFLKKISKVKKDGATVVGLFGDLGSGKTTFTQAIGNLLKVKEVITSPTFVIMKRYPLSYKVIKFIKLSSDKKNKINSKKQLLTFNFQPSTLVHIDAYRLDSGKELDSLGFKEISEDPGNLILIEWPERVADILPSDLVKINFKFISENEREIEI